VVGRGDVALLEALPAPAVALLDLQLLSLHAAQRLFLLHPQLAPQVLLVGKGLALQEGDLVAPVLARLPALQLAAGRHPPLLLQSPVLQFQLGNVLH
jgi:hypothetical protein